MFQKEGQVDHHLGNEQDIFNKLPSQIQTVQENAILKQNVTVLEDINKQLGQQLMQLQLRFGIYPKSFKLSKQNQQDFVQGLAQKNLSYISVLFESQQLKIKELEKILEKMYQDYRDNQTRADFLIQDNTTLRDQLEEKLQVIMELYKEGPLIDNAGNSYIKLEHQDLNSRIDLLVEENKELFNKFQDISVSLLMITLSYSFYTKGKYSEVNRLWEDLKKSSEEMQQKYIKQNDKCQKFEKEIDQLKDKNDLLEKELNASQKASIDFEGQMQDLISQLSMKENELKLCKTKSQNLNKNFEDGERKKNEEIRNLNDNLQELQDKDREATQKLNSLERELDNLREVNNKISREREILKVEKEEIDRNLDNLKSRVATFEKKEENARKLQKEQKEQVQNALLERDKAVLREKQLDKKLDTIQETHKDEMNQLRDQNDRYLEKIQENSKREIDEKDGDIESLSDQLNAVTSEKDKISRELKFLQQENKRLTLSIRDDFGNVSQSKFQEYERRIQELEEKLQSNDQYYNDKIYATQVEKEQVSSTQKNADNMIKDFKANNDKLNSENYKFQSEISQLKMKLDSSLKEKKSVLDEITNIKKLFESKLQYTQEQFGFKMADVQEQLNLALKRERTSRENAIELLQAHDQIEEKMKQDYENKIKELENYLQALTDENNSLKIKHRHPNPDK